MGFANEGRRWAIFVSVLCAIHPRLGMRDSPITASNQRQLKQAPK